MNWEAVGAVCAAVALIFTAAGGIYVLTKDNKHWITALIGEQKERIDRAEKNHAAYAEQQTSVLRDHYTARRDFDRHETEQRADMDEIKGTFRDLHRKIDDLPDVIMRRMNK